MYKPREIPLNTQMQIFASNMVHVLSGDYSKTLGQMYETLFTEHRSRTASNHYIMGDNAFFADQAVHKVGAVKFNGRSTSLDEDLHEAHYAWYNEYVEFKTDRGRIEQTLRSIIMRAASWQDFRDMFPEYILRDFIPRNDNLIALYRTRPDLYAGPIHSPDFEKNMLDRDCWDRHVLYMYGQIGGTLSMYVGYKFL